MSQKKYSDEFRVEALKKLTKCANVSALARELGIRRKWLYQWRDDARAVATGEARVEDPEKVKLRRQVAELEQC